MTSQIGPLSSIQFGARVSVRNRGDWLFLGWNEDGTKLWLAKHSEAPLKRGPVMMTIERENVIAFGNPIYYEVPAAEDRAPENEQRTWACYICSSKDTQWELPIVHIEGERCPQGELPPWERLKCECGHTNYNSKCLPCFEMRRELGWEKW
jgi:hypothetical protein